MSLTEHGGWRKIMNELLKLKNILQNERKLASSFLSEIDDVQADQRIITLDMVISLIDSIVDEQLKDMAKTTSIF